MKIPVCKNLVYQHKSVSLPRCKNIHTFFKGIRNNAALINSYVFCLKPNG